MPTLDGVKYPMLMLDDLDLDELIVFERVSGIRIDQAEEAAGGFHAGLLKALLVLTITREKPEVPLREIEERVGKLKLLDLEDVFAEESVEEDANPPEPEPEEKPAESEQSSGESGEGVSEISPDAFHRIATGSQPSDTGARSVQTTSGDLRRVS